MTLLFFLRSPAGITDTAAPGDVPLGYYERPEFPKRKTKKEKREELAARAKLIKAFDEETKRLKRKKDLETIWLLFTHEFEDYDD
jgi:hypothetical protein